MEEAEKMAALKRAYAEIILNTAKEAAARILVSERKAVSLQQDLHNSKEEALRVLLRMKRMMESKTAEAETKSQRQRERIEVLEAQLEEAEEIIVNLREELQQAYDALEKANNSKLLNIDGGSKEDASLHKGVNNGGILINTSMPVLHYRLDSVIEGVTNSLTDNFLNNGSQCDSSNITKQAEQVDNSNSVNVCSQDSDLTSIVTGNKEPELYKNGCTHRIHASERDLACESLIGSGDVNYGFVSNANYKREENCLVRSNTNAVEMVKKALRVGYKKLKVHPRRRKARLFKIKCTSHRSHLGPMMNHCQQSSVIFSSRTPLANGNARSEEDSSDGPVCKSEELNTEKSIHVCYTDSTRSGDLRSCSSYSSPGHPCKTNPIISNEKCEQKSSVSDEEPKVDLPLLDTGLTLSPQSNLESADSEKKVKLLDQSRTVSSAEEKETGVTSESVLIRQENDAAESSLHNSCEFNPNVSDVPAIDGAVSNTNLIEEGKRSPSHGDGMRIFKFTFQRKRKKENVSNYDGKPDLETGSVKKRALLNKINAEEP